MKGTALFFLVLCAVALVSFAQTYSSAWKVDKLNELSHKQPMIDMDSRSFEKFIDGPRNFSAVIMFTAMNPKQNCHVCRETYPEFEIVAKSWYSLGHVNRLYFGVVDYANAADIFSKMKFTSAPLILHFPPNEGPFAKAGTKKDTSKYDIYDINRNGATAEDIALYVQTIVQTDIPVKRPLNLLKIFSPIIVLVFIGFFAVFLYNKIEFILKNTIVWSVVATLFVLIMIGGQMWNSIRGPPYSGRDEVISGSFQQQYGIETRIVSTLYGMGAVAIVGLAHVPLVNPKYHRTLIYVYCSLFFLSASLIMYVFRIKNRGYPFKLLF